MKKNIGIIVGGDSSEYDVSLRSGANIYDALDKDIFNVYTIVISGRKWVALIDGVEYGIDKNDFSFNIDNRRINIDYAYISIHGTPGENGLLQGYLDMMKIPYSTSSALIEAMTFDKYVCNNYLRGFDIDVPNSVIFKRTDKIDVSEVVEHLGLPCFVKPNSDGSSFGASKASDEKGIRASIDNAFNNADKIIIEEFIEGREFTCGIYKTKGKKMVLPIVEVISYNEFFDFEAKYDPTKSEEIVPARFDEKLTNEIQELTSRIYDIFDCRGIIRVDGIVNRDGRIIVLEVNTTPGMTANSFIPKMLKAADLNITNVFTEIILS